MADELTRTRNVIWRETGFAIRQERDRESDDFRRLSDLFTFEDLNPQVQFSTRFTRSERIRLGLFFIKSAIFGDR